MVPRVESKQQAKDAVAATRYPPAGQRGVGGGFARATRWTAVSDYLPRAEDAHSLIVQIESQQAIEALPEILEVEGIDSFFFGPADLAASMGYLGQPRHPKVQAIVDEAIALVVASGKIAGMQAFNYDDARHFQSVGARMLAVGADVTLLGTGATALIARFS
jgi:4-hydroxy-2-oxoheptanedioate aldolase